MKKIYLALVMLMVGASAQAQRQCDLQLTGSLTGSLSVDATGATPTYYNYQIKNNGPDAIAATDTVIFGTLYSTIAGGFYGVAIPAGTTVTYKDTAHFNAGPADGSYTLCDTILMLSSASDPAVDPVSTNNKFCQSVTVVNIGGTAISDVFSVVKKVKTGTLAVMPNPASGIVNFDFVAKNNTEVNARVYDLTGRTVMTTNFGKGYMGQSGYSLDLSSLTTGMYFVELSQEGVRAVGKVSKQ